MFIPVVKLAPRGMFRVLAASVWPLNIQKALLVRVQELTSQLCGLLEVPPMGRTQAEKELSLLLNCGS